jgi:hypothetical protein
MNFLEQNFVTLIHPGNALEVLAISVQFRYPPAMYQFAVIQLENSSTPEHIQLGLGLLMEASQRYEHLASLSYLLLFSLRTSPERYPDVIERLATLVEQKVPEVNQSTSD